MDSNVLIAIITGIVAMVIAIPAFLTANSAARRLQSEKDKNDAEKSKFNAEEIHEIVETYSKRILDMGLQIRDLEESKKLLQRHIEQLEREARSHESSE